MTQNIEWVAVFKSNNLIEAEIIRGHLENEEIPAVIINKQNSAYLTIVPGLAEVHVPITYQKEAEQIISNAQHNNNRED